MCFRFPQRAFRGGDIMATPRFALCFGLVWFYVISKGRLMRQWPAWVTGGPSLRMRSVGAFSLRHLLGAQRVLSVSLSDDSPSRHSERNRQCARCGLIPCLMFIITFLRTCTPALSHWHRKVFEFLPTFGGTVR